MRPIRVLVAGHDMGGINLLVPLLRSWSASPDFEVEFLSTPVLRRDVCHQVPNLTLASGASELTEQMCHRSHELDQYLSRVVASAPYDVVVCGTSAHALLERRLLVAARQAGVVSVAFCDMWWAYADRFHDGASWTLPDRLWVIDELMGDAAAQIAWPRPLPIDVVGSPLFGELRDSRSHNADSGHTIRFISEPVSTRFPEVRIDEFALAEKLVTAVRGVGLDLPIVIRPHPVDSQEAWRRWIYARRDSGVALESLPIEAAILDTARAVGISSILLTEMRMCGVPVASLQPIDADLSYYCLPFESLGIARISDAESLAAWLTTPIDNSPPQAAAVHVNAVANATRLVRQLVLNRHGSAA